MYGFNRYEALRSFRKAAELDPGAAMAHWGVAMATGPYINMDGEPTYDMKTSCAAVDSGLKAAAAERERAYLEAVRTRCPDFAKPDAYIAAMRALCAAMAGRSRRADAVRREPDAADAMALVYRRRQAGRGAWRKRSARWRR